MGKEYEPKATDTRCGVVTSVSGRNARHCMGTLHRTDDGASRLSEIMDAIPRIVLQCDRCQSKWSVSAATAEFERGMLAYARFHIPKSRSY